MRAAAFPALVGIAAVLVLCLFNVPATNAAGGYEVKFARELLATATTAIDGLTATNDATNQEKVRDLLYLTDIPLDPAGDCEAVVLDVAKDIGPARLLVTAVTNLAAAHAGAYANAQQNDANNANGGSIGTAVINKLTADINAVDAAADKTFTVDMCRTWANLRGDAAYQNTGAHFNFKQRHKRLLHKLGDQHVLQAAGDSDVDVAGSAEQGIDAIAETQSVSEAETELMNRIATEHLAGAGTDSTARLPANALGMFVSLLMNALFFDALRLGTVLLPAPANINTDTTAVAGNFHSYIYFPWTGVDGNSCHNRFGYPVTGGPNYCMIRGFLNCNALFTANDPNKVGLNRGAGGTIERCIAFAPRRPWWNAAGPAGGGNRFSFEDGIIPLMVVQYNTAKFRPNWVAWRISKHVVGRYGGRAEYFRPAPELSTDVHSTPDRMAQLVNENLIAGKFPFTARSPADEPLGDWLWRCLKKTSAGRFKVDKGVEMFSYDKLAGSDGTWVNQYIFQRKAPVTKDTFNSVIAELQETQAFGWTRGHNVGSGMMGGGGIRALSTFTFINMAINHAPFDNYIWEKGSETVIATHVQQDGGPLFYYAVTGCSPSSDAAIGSIWTVGQYWNNAGDPAATHPLGPIDPVSPVLAQFYVPKYMFSYVLAPDASKPLFSYCEQKIPSIKLILTDADRNKNLAGVIGNDCKTADKKNTIGTAWNLVKA